MVKQPVLPIFRKIIFRDFLAILLSSQVPPAGAHFGMTCRTSQTCLETPHEKSELQNWKYRLWWACGFDLSEFHTLAAILEPFEVSEFALIFSVKNNRESSNEFVLEICGKFADFKSL